MDLNDLKVTVITNFDREFYSGMLPGYINNSFTLDEVSFKVKDYCNNPNIELVFDEIVEIDNNNNLVITQNSKYEYDYISMNLGSKSIEIFGSENYNLHYVKPIYGFKNLKNLNDDTNSLLIIGAGAAGVELALSYRSVYPKIKITIIDRHKDVLLKFNKKTRKIAKKLLNKRNINLLNNININKINKNTAYYDKGKIEFDQALISTGVTGVDINYKGFEVDENNFLLVDSNLFATKNALAIGDMVHLREYPNTPKAGVFAIRMTPILVNNLFSIIFGKGEIQSYKPQKIYLQIINTSDGKAILSWGKFAIYNSLALKIKNKIDTDYMKGNLVTDSFTEKFEKDC